MTSEGAPPAPPAEPGPATAHSGPGPTGQGEHPAAGQDPATGRGEHPTYDTSVAHQARIYDYWLGGKDNYAADRAAGDAATRAYPDIAASARANRAFLGRAVHYLAGQAGIRQFLDIGTGIPAAGNTHEVAQAIAPDARIVYVDNDPIVLAHARALLTSTPHGATDYLHADLRDPAAILAQAASTLDLTQPTAITLLAILQAIADDDDPHGIVATLIDAMPSGSYLALSHPPSDAIGADQTADVRNRLNRLSYQQFVFRSRAEVTRFFDGLDLVEPGVVQTHQWRPDAGDPDVSASLWCGVARKP